MCRRRGWLVAPVMWALALLLPAGGALAQTAYQAALDRSLAAHAAGDQAVAQAFMEQAHAIEPSARTLRGLGVIAYADGRKVDAVGYLEAALVSPVRALTPELRGAVEELLSRAFREVARVRVAVEPADSEVMVDGAAPVWHAPNELLVPAGVHELAVAAAGRLSYVIALSLAPGARETVHVVLAEQPPTTVAIPTNLAAASAVPAVDLPARAGLSAQPASSPRADAHRPLTWWTPSVRNGVLIGGGVVAVGSIALWATAARRFGVLRDHCLAHAEGGCDESEARRLMRDAHVTTYERAAVASTVLAGASLLGGLALTLWQRNAHADRPLAVRVSAAEASLQATF